MPNNSCTVILNGHGFYSKNYIIDVSNINYSIYFPCSLDEQITRGHHNFLLNSLVIDLPKSLTLLESLPSTYISNNSFQQNKFVKNMLEKTTKFIYDHMLVNAPDVRDVQDLTMINPQKFISYNITIDPLIRQWSGTLKIEFDPNQIKDEVIQAHQVPNYQYSTNINLSKNIILYITPVAPQNIQMKLQLSDLLDDILPKIKIPVSYHQSNLSADVIPSILLDDNNFQNRISDFEKAYPGIFNHKNDLYHECIITGDANIIWDACRDFVPE